MSGVAQGGALPPAVLPGFAGATLGAAALPPATTAGAAMPAWGSFAGLLAQAATGPALGPDAVAAPGAALWSAVSLPNGAAALTPDAAATDPSAAPAAITDPVLPGQPGAATAVLTGVADPWPDAWSVPGDDIGLGLAETPWSRDADLPPPATRSSALVPLRAMQGLQRLEQALMQAEALQAGTPVSEDLARSASAPALSAWADPLEDDGDAPAQDLGRALSDTVPAWMPAASVATEVTAAAQATAGVPITAAAGVLPNTADAAPSIAGAAAVAATATGAAAVSNARLASDPSSASGEPAGDRGPTTRSVRGDTRSVASRPAPTAATPASVASADPARSPGAVEAPGSQDPEPDHEPGGTRHDRHPGSGLGLHTTSVLQQAAAAVSSPETRLTAEALVATSGDRALAGAASAAGDASDASTGGRDAASPQAGVSHGALPQAATRAADGARFAQELASTFEARLSTPVQSPQFGGALGLQISTLVRHGISEARLQLNPAELGPIAVQIALDGTATQVHLAADHVLTRQALEQALPQLASALSDAGFTLSGGGVSQQTASEQSAAGDSRRESSAPGGARPGAASADGDDGVPMPMTVRRQLPGQVDLYA